MNNPESNSRALKIMCEAILNGETDKNTLLELVVDAYNSGKNRKPSYIMSAFNYYYRFLKKEVLK